MHATSVSVNKKEENLAFCMCFTLNPGTVIDCLHTKAIYMIMQHKK